MRSTHHASSSFTSSFLSSPGGGRTFCERWQFIVDDDVDKNDDVNVVFTNEEFTEKRKAERRLCCREPLLPPLAYRTPARRFRRADGERRGEEDEGDATARSRWCRGKRTLSFEMMSRRRSLVQKSSRRGRRATTGSSSKPPSSFSTSETTTTTTTSFFLSEPEDEDEENDIYYYGPRTSSSARLAAVVEKYKTFLESKNMRLPRWLL